MIQISQSLVLNKDIGGGGIEPTKTFAITKF